MVGTGERLELVGACPLVVTDVGTGTSPDQFLMTFQVEALTDAQRATLLSSGQDPSFVSDTMRQSIEHGGASTGSQCTSSLTVGMTPLLTLLIHFAPPSINWTGRIWQTTCAEAIN